MMSKILSSALILGALLFYNCTSAEDKPLLEDITKVENSPFTQGSITMGIFSEDVDLGSLIDKVDFSKDDVKKQYENLHQNDPMVQEIFEVIQKKSKDSPLVAWAMTSNILQSTYYIDNDEVLADVKGFGWNMSHYHNKSKDKGSMYLETLVDSQHILKDDKKIYVQYTPSNNEGTSGVNTLDLSQFTREELSEKKNIAGYDCNVVVYTPKVIDNNSLIQMYKIVVYTSSLFSPAINFTHPFYLEEKGGILALDIYYQDSETPTLVMKPKQIKAQKITTEALTSKTALPIYNYDDVNWAVKSLAIMMSGWRVLD